MIIQPKVLKKNNTFSLLLIFVLVPFFCFINSCKKKDALITIKGTVTNSGNQFGVSSVNVKIFSKELDNNTFSNSFKLLKSSTTDASGGYHFEFEYRNALEYKIEISSQNYFNYTNIINPDDLKVNETNTLNIELDPKSTLKLRIRNQIPQNNQDNIVFNSLNSNCDLCYNPAVFSFNGLSVDTTIIYNTLGQRYWKYAYYVTKNSFTQSYNDSVYCTPGDTAMISIFY